MKTEGGSLGGLIMLILKGLHVKVRSLVTHVRRPVLFSIVISRSSNTCLTVRLLQLQTNKNIKLKIILDLTWQYKHLQACHSDCKYLHWFQDFQINLQLWVCSLPHISSTQWKILHNHKWRFKVWVWVFFNCVHYTEIIWDQWSPSCECQGWLL